MSKISKLRRNYRLGTGKFVHAPNGRAIVTRTNRGVRLSVVTDIKKLTGRPITASFAFIDLDEVALDRLVARLQRVRGGRRAL